MPAFTIVWIGQLLSQLGTQATLFGLTIWAWQEMGQATALALVGFFSFAPLVLLSPLAGALVDRSDRRLMMMLSDLAAALATAVTLALLSGRLEIWHLYALGAWTGAFSAFQFPAYSAAISTMVSGRHYARASGMLSLAESGATVVAPLLAAGVIAAVGIAPILIADLIGFGAALLALLWVRIPQPAPSAEGRAGRGDGADDGGGGAADRGGGGIGLPSSERAGGGGADGGSGAARGGAGAERVWVGAGVGARLTLRGL